MPVASGKFGAVNGVDTTRNWSIAHTAALNRAVASNSGSGAMRTDGPHSWSGTYAKYGAIPVHWPGDFFTFTGYTAPDNGIYGTTGYTYSGTAYVDSIALTWDWTTGAALSHVVNFSGHLVLTKSSQIITDLTDPDIVESVGTKIQFGVDVATTPTVMQNLTTATLTLSMPSQGYTNSSTYDATTQKIWTGRARSGPFDWNLSIGVQDNNGAILPPVSTRLGWRIFTNATQYWHLEWGRAREHSGITVDTEAAAIIAATVNVDMDGNKTGTGLGTVVAPDGTQVWPIAP